MGRPGAAGNSDRGVWVGGPGVRVAGDAGDVVVFRGVERRRLGRAAGCGVRRERDESDWSGGQILPGTVKIELMTTEDGRKWWWRR